MSAPNQQVLCKQCNTIFSNYNALMRHKGERMKAGQHHIHCQVCGKDFHHVETRIIHIQQAHAKEQNLVCPGCNETFVRVGGLIAHIEQDKCESISTNELNQHRAKKLEFAEELEKRSGSQFGDYFPASHPSAKSASALRPHIELNKANPVYFKADDFPKLNSPTYRDGNSKQPDLLTSSETKGPDERTMGNWGKQVELFPDVPPALRPSRDQLASATAPNVREQAASKITNPNHPLFDANTFYNDFNNRYNCPMPNCTISFESAPELAGHLRAATKGGHAGRRLQCPTCLRYFQDVTALTQHAESQGSRCYIRYSENYRPFVDQLTAGIADVIGLHTDDTPRYEISTDAHQTYGTTQREKMQKAVEEHHQKIEKERESYWASREPNW